MINCFRYIFDVIFGLFKKEEKPIDAVMGVPIKRKTPIKILIDNGHGKETKGKRSPFSANRVMPSIDFYEWSWNREIAKEIVSRLCDLGYDAELLVPEEKDIYLSERVRRVNHYCNELGSSNVLLVSIHANASGDGSKWHSGNGWSAYTTKGHTKSDILSEYLYDEAENIFKDKKIRTDYSDGDRDWEENFYILQKTFCPAVLTENFFYDNILDVKYILSAEGKENVIKCHVNGISKYVDAEC